MACKVPEYLMIGSRELVKAGSGTNFEQRLKKIEGVRQAYIWAKSLQREQLEQGSTGVFGNSKWVCKLVHRKEVTEGKGSESVGSCRPLQRVIFPLIGDIHCRVLSRRVK